MDTITNKVRFMNNLQVEVTFNYMPGSMTSRSRYDGFVTGVIATKLAYRPDECHSLKFHCQTKLRYKNGLFPGEGELVERTINVDSISLLTPAGSNEDPYAGSTVA